MLDDDNDDYGDADYDDEGGLWVVTCGETRSCMCVISTGSYRDLLTELLLCSRLGSLAKYVHAY